MLDGGDIGAVRKAPPNEATLMIFAHFMDLADECQMTINNRKMADKVFTTFAGIQGFLEVVGYRRCCDVDREGAKIGVVTISGDGFLPRRRIPKRIAGIGSWNRRLRIRHNLDGH